MRERAEQHRRRASRSGAAPRRGNRSGTVGAEHTSAFAERQRPATSRERLMSDAAEDPGAQRRRSSAVARRHRRLINSQPDMVMVAQASSGREAIQQFREHRPDVTLMDLRLPDMSGIDAMIAIRSEFPDARDRHADDLRGRRGDPARARGRRARLHAEEHAAERAGRCRPAGPRRQEAHPARGRGAAGRAPQRRGADRARDRVSSAVAGGNRNRDIAERLSISEETVKVHVKHIMEKLGRAIGRRPSRSRCAAASSSCKGYLIVVAADSNL